MKLLQTSWKTLSWGDLVTLEYGKAIRGYQNHVGDYPVFGTNGQIGFWDEYLCPNSGVIVGRKGAYRGIHFSTKPFFVIDTAFYLKPKDNQIDLKWAYYQLLDFDINKMDSGSAIPSTSRDAFYAVEVNLPPLPTQRKIAGILSAYDDLIENNTRRIAILEEMAQSIYREWFVNFRFPGHENVKLVDSPLGKIPEGWKWSKLKDICDSVNYGYTASANKEVRVGPRFLRITDIVPTTIDWENVPFCEVDEDAALKYALREGDIVIARTGATTGYAKRLHKRHPKSVFASYLVRIVPNNAVGKHYIGLIVESDDYKAFIKRNLGGAAQPQANAQVLTSLDVLVPYSDVITAFDCHVEPLADQREILQVKNSNLRKTRDLLLPKLISGQLNVEELDIETGEPLLGDEE